MACHMWNHYLSQCWLTDSRHSEISIKIHMYKRFFVQKCIWKWHPQNCNYFLFRPQCVLRSTKLMCCFNWILPSTCIYNWEGKYLFQRQRICPNEEISVLYSDSGSSITSDTLFLVCFYCGDFIVQRVTRTFQLHYLCFNTMNPDCTFGSMTWVILASSNGLSPVVPFTNVV